MAISIHALREEGDNSTHFLVRCSHLFLSTPSARRATACYLLPRPQCPISIHALREEGDSSSRAMRPPPSKFLSTPSARRATAYQRPRRLNTLFLSTPSARRATAAVDVVGHIDVISIHALREEGDIADQNEALEVVDFYLRPPRGGRRQHSCRSRDAPRISIHALREEGDLAPAALLLHDGISIHALREEGDCSQANSMDCAAVFLSTPSARRATGHLGGFLCCRRISIHALREEGDRYTTI